MCFLCSSRCVLCRYVVCDLWVYRMYAVCVCILYVCSVCMRACVHACMRACVHACVHVRVHVCVHVCVCVCVHVCVYVCAVKDSTSDSRHPNTALARTQYKYILPTIQVHTTYTTSTHYTSGSGQTGTALWHELAGTSFAQTTRAR